MALLKSLITTFTLIFNAGTILLLFFIILGGAFEHFPLNTFYWLQADTSGIKNAPAETRWTLWGFCSVGSNGKNTDCSGNKPAFAFQPDRTFDTQTGVPSDFIDNHSTYFFLSRFGFPLFIIGLFFSVISLILGVFSYFSRLGAAVSAAVQFLTFLFVAAAASVSTACYVMAKDKFNDQGSSAKLGVRMMAFQWTATALTLLSMIGYCFGWHRAATRNADGVGAAGGAATGGFAAADRSSFEKAGTKRRGFFNVGRRNNAQYDDDAFVQGGTVPIDNESQEPVIARESSFERGQGI